MNGWHTPVEGSCVRLGIYHGREALPLDSHLISPAANRLQRQAEARQAGARMDYGRYHGQPLLRPRVVAALARLSSPQTLFALFGDSPSGPAQPPERLADAQLAPNGKTTAPRAALTANHPLPNQPPPPWLSTARQTEEPRMHKGTTTTVLSASTPRNPPRIQLLQSTALASLPELDGNESANTMWRHTAAEASTCSYSPSAHDDGLCDATLLLSLCICDLKVAGRLQKQHSLHASRNTTP
ncbi:hypothetical protein CSOJ01_00386 [Colletotrichum sojae]|uniref:Uncharacterized protein n=1 Tax=Colletotrichum sojae TaxID=2175907 RepID=A0A8H6N675_9PEZI|nr:hypothetical protein CSOJ01_00386 [Colletotrichum sojae]